MVFKHPFSNSTVPHLFVIHQYLFSKPLRLQEATRTGSGGGGANTSEVDRSNKRAATHFASPFHLGTQRGYDLLLVLSLFLQLCCIPSLI